MCWDQCVDAPRWADHRSCHVGHRHRQRPCVDETETKIYKTTPLVYWSKSQHSAYLYLSLRPHVLQLRAAIYRRCCCCELNWGKLNSSLSPTCRMLSPVILKYWLNITEPPYLSPQTQRRQLAQDLDATALAQRELKWSLTIHFLYSVAVRCRNHHGGTVGDLKTASD